MATSKHLEVVGCCAQNCIDFVLYQKTNQGVLFDCFAQACNCACFRSCCSCLDASAACCNINFHLLVAQLFKLALTALHCCNFVGLFLNLCSSYNICWFVLQNRVQVVDFFQQGCFCCVVLGNQTAHIVVLAVIIDGNNLFDFQTFDVEFQLQILVQLGILVVFGVVEPLSLFQLEALFEQILF